MQLLTAFLTLGSAARLAFATPSVAAAWYAGWHSDDFPLSAVSWDKYTHLTYSFAVTTPDVRNISLSGSNPDLLPTFVSTAHQNGVKALVSVGGWTGSRWYSTNVGSAANRTAFVNTIVDFAEQYDLDGIDFDWEYPGSQGIGCNTISPQDTANFLTFLQELRANSKGASLMLTAATSLNPWVDASGDPSSSLAGFAKVLDFIAIMNYDVWGPWAATVGPNAPLRDSCAPSASQIGSATDAVQKWSDAGIPKDQIILGVAGYGHSYRVSPEDAFVNGTVGGQLALYPAFDASNQPVGDSWDDPAGVDECGNFEGQGGLFDFWGLIDAGFLTAQGSPAKGISYVFDSCTETPFVYNATSEVMVSFDNAQSFADKGKFIQSSGLAGFSMWEAGGDSDDILLDSIRSAAGM